MRLNGKLAIITGGCRGIGAAIVQRFINEGADKIFVLDYVIPEDIKFFEDENLNQKIICIQTDVSSEESVNSAFKTVLESSSRIDILVNNAGITRDNLLIRLTEKDWDSVLDTNLKGAFFCCRAASKTMMSQRQGRIINIGSVVGAIGNAGQSNYSASKAGLFGFTKSLAKELGSRNILVNCIAPGYVATPMTDKLTDEQKNLFLVNVPLKRVAQPEDVASAVLFFASEDSAYITGQVLHVDGGLAM